MRELVRQAPYARHLILDFRRVTGTDAVCVQMLATFGAKLANSTPAVRLLYCNVGPLGRLLTTHEVASELILPDADAALESCEDALLAELQGTVSRAPQAVGLAQCELLRECAAEDIAWLETRLPARRFAAGESIVLTGGQATEFFLITSGTAEVRLRLADGRRSTRVDVFSAGMSFGEVAFLDGSPRSADVIALDLVECRSIDRECFDSLAQERPQLKIALLAALSRQLCASLRKTNRELVAMRS